MCCSQGRKDFNPDVRNFCSIQQGFGEEDSARAEKVIIVGDHSSGKTCLVRRFSDNTYTEGYKATIGVDFVYKQFEILGKPFTLHIWDTAGQEQFKCISKQYFRGATAVILAFDLQDEGSFAHTKEWLEEVQKETDEDIFIFLVGLKADKFDDLAEDTAFKMNAEYWETSAKSNKNVSELFERIAGVLFERSIQRSIASKQHSQEIGSIDMQASTSSAPPKKACCAS